MDEALADVIVADFTQLLQGGWATQKLADMGADVIKIEPPSGDSGRHMAFCGERIDGVGPGFLAVNRNKRSIAIDLKTDVGHDAVKEIVKTADVVVENFRPGVMERLGFGYEDVVEYNEDVIYASGSAYGPTGPDAERPGQDLLYQALSGLANATGRSGEPPSPAGTVVVDEHSATLLALHIMYALYHREQTGRGQRIDGSLLNASLDLASQEITFAANTGTEPGRGKKTHGHPALGAPYGIFETSDGYVAIGYSPLDTVTDVLDITLNEEVANASDPYRYRDQIHDEIERETRTYASKPLIDKLAGHDIQAEVVQAFSDVPEHPQVQHNEMIVDIDHPHGGTIQTTGFPVKMSETPGTISRGPPALGEHTTEVLRSVGFDESNIDEMRSQDVLPDSDHLR